MVTKTEAIKNFLAYKTHPDLANLYSLNMECQVNVAQDNGERVEGDYKGRAWHGWRGADGTVWKSFRIPWNANKSPEYTDSDMSYDLAQHAEGIGMTGWDWVTRCSKWVAFDFDSITGHQTVGLSDTELQEVLSAAKDIDWVTIRKSTSGNGLHFYVFLDNVPTENHNEHAALARAILGMMSGITGYNFSAKIDCCGGNMWVWHRKMEGTQGLKLIKHGSVLYDVPQNWRDHIKVVTGARRKNLPQFVEDSSMTDAERVFEELTGQRSIVNLDDEHRRLIKHLEGQSGIWWWDSDNQMLVTHTYILKTAHKELSFKGLFDTASDGGDLNTQNCFCYPLRKGAWIVRRFTPGVHEKPCWLQDASGWTYCYYNKEPNLQVAAKSQDGIEHKKGGFVFPQAEQAMLASEALGVHMTLPNWILNRRTVLRQHKDGRLMVEIEHQATDRADDMRGWLPEKGEWTRIFDQVVSSPDQEPETANYDDIVRHIVTETGEDYGWTIKSGEIWQQEPLQHVRVALKAMGLNPKDAETVLGSSVFKCWKLVNKPFQPEYPGDRQWNRGAAQFRFTPSTDTDNLNYPTWQRILQHCGAGLDTAVKNNTWASNNGIVSGADYLKCWIASLLQSPEEPLPYLFFYGPQNSGKSIFHEAMSLLVTKGYQRADQALSDRTEFNGELEGAIICVVEETDLRKSRTAYNRIKDWVTSRQLNIRHLYRAPYHIPNTTHWIHCANDLEACPIFTGDTRITMSYIDSLDPADLIPKKILIPKLEKEAPDFLASVLHLEIPQSRDRLNVPVITTSEKTQAEAMNMSSLEIFIKEQCYQVPGEMVLMSEFFDRFVAWLDPIEAMEWTKIRVGRELPSKHPKGRRRKDSHFCIGNISFEDKEPTGPKLICNEGRLE